MAYALKRKWKLGSDNMIFRSHGLSSAISKSRHFIAQAHIALFFFAYFLFIWLWVKPSLFYYQFPISNENKEMYQILPYADFPFYPGKIVDFLSSQLTHFYYYSWIGALLITAAAFLLYVSTTLFVRSLTQGQTYRLGFLPAIIILMQCCRYEYDSGGSLSILMALALFAACSRPKLHLLPALVRFALFLILSAAVLVVAVRSYLVFVIACGLYELVVGRLRMSALMRLLSIAAVPYCVNELFFDTV